MQNVLKNQINVFLKDLDHSVSGDMHVKNDKKNSLRCPFAVRGGDRSLRTSPIFNFFPNAKEIC